MLIEARPARPTAVTLPSERWIALIALLIAEVLLLTLRFDTGAFRDDPRWWWLIGRSALIARVGFAAALGSLLIGGSGWLRDLRRYSEELRSHRAWIPLVAHLTAFAIYFRLTAMIVARGERGGGPVDGWAVAAWWVMGAATLGAWAATLVPIRLWMPLARRGAAGLAVGGAVGAGAVGVGLLAAGLWHPLGNATFWSVQGLLGLICRDLVCRPSEFVLGTPDFHVEISWQCSGYEGMGLIAVLMAAYLWGYRRDLRFPQVLVLIPLGVVLMWSANVARIAILVAIGSWISPAVALGGFHSMAGWLTLIAVGLGLITCTQRMRYFAADRSAAVEDGGWSNPAAAYLLPALSITAMAMIARAFSSGEFDPFYPARVLVAAAVLWSFRRNQIGWDWVGSWGAVGLGVVAFAVWMVLEPSAHGPAAVEPIGTALAALPRASAAVWLFFRVAGSVLTVPLAEELAFRGYLTRRLIAADFEAVPLGRFSWASFVVSSLIFGALHGRWVAGTLAGMIFALALYRRGRLADAVVAHATTNALIAAWVLGTGSWSLWS